MDLLNHFIEEDTEYMTLKLKHQEMQQLMNKLPERFRNCYITDDDLRDRVANLEIAATEVIESCVPNIGNVMSGEFGEILSYYILMELYKPLQLDGPKKWIWKEDKNKPIQKTDVVLFNYEVDNPSEEDLIVSAEIKSKATRSNSYDPIKNAIEGANDDYLGRLSKTLIWLKDRYIRDNDGESLRELKRFLNPVNYGTYKKHFKAVAIIDSNLLNEELERERDIDTDIIQDDFGLIIISINNLKNTYETTYEKVIDTGRDFI